MEYKEKFEMVSASFFQLMKINAGRTKIA